MSERPDNAVGRQSSRDLHVLEHVIAVINVHEIMPKRLAENEPGDCAEKNANHEDQPTVFRIGRADVGWKRHAPARMDGSFVFSRSAAHWFGKSVVRTTATNFTLEQGCLPTTADILQSRHDRG
jgi:hypothetical protein